MHIQRCICLFLLALPFARLAAQQLQDPIMVPVRAYAQARGGGSLSVTDGSSISANISSVQSDWVTAQITSNDWMLKPGKTHRITFTPTGLSDYALRIVSPGGYRLFIEKEGDPSSDIERSRVEINGGGGSPSSATFKVRLESTQAMAAGEATGLRPGRVVWSVGLGSLKNGESAGVISIREVGLQGAIYTPAALLFDTDKPDVDVIAPNGVLRQVLTHQCLADVVVDNGTTYWIKFYARYNVGSFQNGVWTTTSTPFVEYRIDQSATNKLRVTKRAHIGGTRESWTELWQNSPTEWRVWDWTSTTHPSGGPTQLSWTYGDLDRDETFTVMTSTGGTVETTRRRLNEFAWGRELTKETLGYSGANPLVSEFTYYTDSSQAGTYRRLKWRTFPTGSWERYDYYEDVARQGLVKTIYRPFLNAPSLPSAATMETGEVITYEYNFTDWTGLRTLPTTIETRINNVVSKRTVIDYSYQSEPGTNQPLLVASQKDYSSNTDYVTTVTKSYRQDADASLRYLPGKVSSVKRPDQTKTVYQYQRANWVVPWYNDFVFDASGSMWVAITYEGTTSSIGSSAFVRLPGSDFTWLPDDDFRLVAGKSTATAVLMEAYGGRPVQKDTYIYTSSGWVRVAMDKFPMVEGVLPSQVSNYVKSSQGTFGFVYQTGETYGYHGGLLSSHTDSEGVTRSFYYDNSGRVSRTVIGAKSGLSSPGDIHIITKYNAAGRLTETRRQTSETGDASQDIVESTTYDTAGRVASSSTPGPNAAMTTSYAYFVDSNPRKTRITFPQGDRVEETHLNGWPKSITGSAQPPKYFWYNREADGSFAYQTTLSPAGWWTDGYTYVRRDWLGRPSFTNRPATGVGADSHTNTLYDYNAQGQLDGIRTLNGAWSDNAVAPSRFTYGNMGEVSWQGLDLDEDGILNPASADRITEYRTSFSNESGAWWVRADVFAYESQNSATPTRQSYSLHRLSEFSIGGLSEMVVGDYNNNKSRTVRSLDRTNAYLTEETWVPGSTTSGLVQTRNGYLVSERSTSGVNTTYSYDLFGRLQVTQGRDQLMAESVYFPKSDFVKHLRNQYMRPGVIGSEWREFVYDGAGRMIEKKINNVGQWRSTRFEYNSMNQVKRQWGSATSPMEIDYNSYGWCTKLRTFRGGSGWDGATWPADTGTADETEWVYHGQTGLVLKKVFPADTLSTTSYPNYDPAYGDRRGVVRFTYNVRNQVKSRTWARGVTTDYLYEDSAGYRTGALRKKDYSDSTPDVEYRYKDDTGNAVHRRGFVHRIHSTGIHSTEQRQFTYRADGQLDTEWLDWGFYGQQNGSGSGRGIRYKYDGASAGRLSGYHLGWASDLDSNQSALSLRIGYGFDGATGRVSSVASTSAGSWTSGFNYGYKAGSDMVQTITNGAYQREYGYQSWRDLINNAHTRWNGAEKAHFQYDYDWLPKRNAVRTFGELASALGRPWGMRVDYLYTNRGELDYSDGTALDGSGYPVGDDLGDQYRDWNYDNRGNRMQELQVGASRSYEPHSLNQYAKRGFDSALSYDADGNLTADSVWTYNYDAENRLISMETRSVVAGPSSPAWKRLEFKYDYRSRRIEKKVLTNANVWTGQGLKAEYFNNQSLSGLPVLTRLDRQVDFDWVGGSPGGPVGSDNFSVRWSGQVIVPAGGEWTFYTTTDDGNTLKVNGETLINDPQMHGPTEFSGSINLSAGVYDIEMTMFEGGGGATARLAWSGPGTAKAIIPASNLVSMPTVDRTVVNNQITRYVWEGWNMIAEIDGNNVSAPVLRTYTWGLDLSHTVAGAGGVGGLLMITEADGSRYYPIYDGNGNVRGMLDGNGSIVARYDYSPFGEVLQASGAYAGKNNFLFASKYYDWESGLYQYNHRFYDPHAGRFVNRDPIGEAGGLNLYAYAGSDPIGSVDVLGLEEFRLSNYSFMQFLSSAINGIGNPDSLANALGINLGNGVTLAAVPGFYSPDMKARGDTHTIWTENAAYRVYKGFISPSTTVMEMSGVAGNDGGMSWWMSTVDRFLANPTVGTTAPPTPAPTPPPEPQPPAPAPHPPTTPMFPNQGSGAWSQSPTGEGFYAPNSGGQQTAWGAALDGGSRYAGAFNETLKFWKWPQALADFAGSHVASAIYFPKEYFNPLSKTNVDYLKWQFGTAEGYGSLAGAGFLGSLAPVPKGPAPVVTSTSFFEGASYTTKVLRQMEGGPGEFHSFPRSVEAFEGAGSLRTITGGDGLLRQVLEIPGSYSGRDGVFQFIKNADGTINHRLFVPGSPP